MVKGLIVCDLLGSGLFVNKVNHLSSRNHEPNLSLLVVICALPTKKKLAPEPRFTLRNTRDIII